MDLAAYFGFRRKKQVIWTIVLDSCTSCPNCDEEMETTLLFYPRRGKVAGLTRSQLQARGFDLWLDKCSKAFEACPNCGYKESGRC
jgi:predicted RNA-binding Zn-ribbon protein involved in translation (DUF1610 family)